MTTSRITALAGSVAIAAALVIGLCGGGSQEKLSPKPVAGEIDLRHWHFRQDGSVPLTGQWLYFDRRWVHEVDPGPAGGVEVTVPGPWPEIGALSDGIRRNGYGTYTLKLLLPPAPAGESYALDTGQILSAYRIFANGRLIAAPGTPGTTAKDERANSYSSFAILPPDARKVSLSVEMSNHVTRYGGIFMPPTVGLRSIVESKRHLTEMLSFLVIGALAFTACYHIAFLRVTRAGYANLWFGLLALVFAARMFLFDPLAAMTVSLIGQNWVWRCDIAATDVLLPVAYWFLALSFPRHIGRKLGYAVTATCLFLALIALSFSPAIGEMTLKSAEITALVVMGFLTQAIFRSAWANDQGAALALLGWIICSLGAIHDIMLDNDFIAGPNLLPLSCVAFFLCLSGALTQRSHHAFTQAEHLIDERTRELQDKIVELERNQVELEHARAAAISANVAKSRFLANMSHELRTPLNAILGFAEIIRDRLLGPDGEERYNDYAASIHASGSHLLGLINDILDLSKIEAGKFELKDARIDLDDEARAALRLLDPMARKKNVRLFLDVNAPTALIADARAIHQVLLNLLSNAVKFTPEGGMVRLSIGRAADNAVVVSVIDNGVGIRPEDMARVFEHFGQGRHDIRPRGEAGTGLGLPIAKGLVEALGGRLEIRSAVNAGTTVTAYLPASRRVPSVPASDAA